MTVLLKKNDFTIITFLFEKIKPCKEKDKTLDVKYICPMNWVNIYHVPGLDACIYSWKVGHNIGGLLAAACLG